MNHLFLPPHLMIGGGCSSSLHRVLEKLDVQRVLLVTDSFLAESGLVTKIADELQAQGFSTHIFSEVQPDPTLENVTRGLALLQSFTAQVVVGIGGGSSIDTAKAISLLSSNPEPLATYAGRGKVPCSGVPIVAIPTTAGTGSEVTQGAVITDTQSHVKMVFMDPHLVPQAALVDYELTMSMPPSLTAHVGIDTLTHGIEAYVSRLAHATTDALALSCIELVSRHLRTAWKEPQNRVAREAMALAACHGGIAFSNSSVALVHGMSRPLGAHFHVPHGLSNAALLPAVTEFSLSGCPQRYAQISQSMGFSSINDSQEKALEALTAGLHSLNNDLQIPRLRDCVGVDKNTFEKLLPQLAEDALISGSPANNPVVPTREDIIELYQNTW